tara:strand:- start:28 stop:318 length:291 start_codon:yes stop_codon:yes gene_type:complete
MLAVATPDAPTFQEHYNPNVELIVLTSTPDGSDTLEERYTFARYFEFIFFAEGDRRYREMMKAFDEVGYYETFTPYQDKMDYYPTTIFPVTDNTRQ